MTASAIALPMTSMDLRTEFFSFREHPRADLGSIGVSVPEISDIRREIAPARYGQAAVALQELPRISTGRPILAISTSDASLVQARASGGWGFW